MNILTPLIFSFHGHCFLSESHSTHHPPSSLCIHIPTSHHCSTIHHDFPTCPNFSECSFGRFHNHSAGGFIAYTPAITLHIHKTPSLACLLSPAWLKPKFLGWRFNFFQPKKIPYLQRKTCSRMLQCRLFHFQNSCS